MVIGTRSVTQLPWPPWVEVKIGEGKPEELGARFVGKPLEGAMTDSAAVRATQKCNFASDMMAQC